MVGILSVDLVLPVGGLSVAVPYPSCERLCLLWQKCPHATLTAHAPHNRHAGRGNGQIMHPRIRFRHSAPATDPELCIFALIDDDRHTDRIPHPGLSSMDSGPTQRQIHGSDACYQWNVVFFGRKKEWLQ